MHIENFKAKFRKKGFPLSVISLMVMAVLINSCGDVIVTPDIDAPTNLRIEKIADGRVTLTWNYLNQTSGIYYVIARKVGEGEWIEDYGQVTGRTFTDDIPTNSYTVYSYRVKAEHSDQEEVTDSYFSEPAAYFSPLTKPASIDIRQLDATHLDISWQDNAIGESGYKVDKKIGDGNWTLNYASLPANATSFKDEFSSLFVNFDYRVYPYVGETNAEKAEISIVPGFPPPQELTAVQLSRNEIKLNWAYPDSEEAIIDGFEIQRRIGTTDWVKIYEKPYTATDHIDVPAIETGTIYYRMRSYKGGDFSVFSEIATVNFNINEVGSLFFNDIASDIIVMGDIAFVANNYNGVAIIDVSNASAPRITGNITLPGRVVSLYMESNYLYAGNLNKSIYIIDITSIENPVLWRQIETIDIPYGINAGYVDDKKYLFAANGIAGLITIALDAADPTNPKIISRHNTQGIAHDLVKEGNTVYLADGYGGIKKFDVSNPANPVKIAENLNVNNALSISIHFNRLYISCGSQGLQVIDKNSLQAVNYLDTPGYVVDHKLSNRYAFLADRDLGLYMISIIDERDFYSLAHLPLSSEAKAIWLQDNYIYFLSEQQLNIVRISH